MSLKHIRDMGEEQVSRLATRLLSNESFVLAVQSIISRTLRTREHVESGMRSLLTSLAVPTSDDLETISERLTDLEVRLDGLSRKVESLEKKKKSSRRKKSDVSSETPDEAAES